MYGKKWYFCPLLSISYFKTVGATFPPPYSTTDSTPFSCYVCPQRLTHYPSSFPASVVFFCNTVICFRTWPKECLFHLESDVRHSSKQCSNGQSVPLILPLSHASLTTPEHPLSLNHIDPKRKVLTFSSSFQRGLLSSVLKYNDQIQS